jgi:tetratricopeptide (TPR) repeat protein
MLGAAIPLSQESRIRETVAALEQVSRQWPEVRSIPAEIGFYLSQLGQWRGAYDILKPLVYGGMLEQTLFPTFGAAAVGTDRLDEADRWLNEALKRYPTHEQDIRTNLATLCLRRALAAMNTGDGRKLSLAESQLKQAGVWLDFVPYDPGGNPARQRIRKLSSMNGMLADIAFARNEYVKSRQLYELALKQCPDLPGAGAWQERIMALREYEARGGKR